MFTIKHCHDFGEDLYASVTNVSATTNQTDPKYGISFKIGEVHYLLGNDIGTPDECPKGERGTVFVMNENGKTVSRYDF